MYEDGAAVASISTVGGNTEEYSEEIFEDSADESEISADTEEAQAPAESSTTDGMWEEVITEADSEALADMGLFDAGQGTVQNVEQIEAVEERYAPVGYDSITSYAEEQKLTTGQLQALYYDLENIIPVIYNDFYAYKENLELFSPSMTNMRYLLIP